MIPRALTIAGSDPTGGAGIQQDLKTFHALGVWGTSAITAITVQDSRAVTSWTPVEPDVVAAQIAAVAEDIGVDAAKTGMIATADIARAVAAALVAAQIDRLVVDPVLSATTGDPLAAGALAAALAEHLIPLATVVTPNANEAAALTGLSVRSPDEQAAAAEALMALGAQAVLVTGGHIDGEQVVDVLLDRQGVERFVARRVHTPDTHGTGCMLSAAITAGLARGEPLRAAVAKAEDVVAAGIAGALRLGKGSGPVAFWGA